MSKILGFPFILWVCIYLWYKCSSFYYLCFSDVALGFKCPIILTNKFLSQEVLWEGIPGLDKSGAQLYQPDPVFVLLCLQWESFPWNYRQPFQFQASLWKQQSWRDRRRSLLWVSLKSEETLLCVLQQTPPCCVDCVSVAKRMRLSWLVPWIRERSGHQNNAWALPAAKKEEFLQGRSWF